MRSTIQFDTKVWEGDFRVVLQPHRMRAMIERNKHDFSRRLVMINNVDAMSGAVRRCKALVRSGIIDDFVVVDEHAQAVLDHFELDRNDFGIGYRYSIAELTALYLADSDLILHFAGDSMLDRDHDWVPASIDLLARRPEVAVVNLVWDGRLESGSGRVLLRGRDVFATRKGFPTRCTWSGVPSSPIESMGTLIQTLNGTPPTEESCSRREWTVGCAVPTGSELSLRRGRTTTATSGPGTHCSSDCERPLSTDHDQSGYRDSPPN